SIQNGEKTPTQGLVRVRAQDGTTVNGTDEATAEGIQNVSVKLDNESNSVSFQDMELTGDLKVKGGKIEDSLSIDGGSFGDDVTLDGGEGNNTLNCAGASIGGDLSFKGSGQLDTALESDCDSTGNLKIATGGGANVVILDDGAHAKTLS